MTLPETIRDATVQRLADRVDEATGVGCFGLARRILTTCAVTGMGTGLVLHGLDQTADAMSGVYDGLVVSVVLLGASSYLRAAERRMAGPGSPGVIPFLRNPVAVTVGLSLAALSACLALPLAALLVRVVQVHGIGRPSAAVLLGGASTLVTLAYPVGLLLACCEWRRRPRVRKDLPSRLAAAPG